MFVYAIFAMDSLDSPPIYGLTQLLYFFLSKNGFYCDCNFKLMASQMLDIQLMLQSRKWFSRIDTERNCIAFSKWEQNQLAENYSISGNGKPLLFSPWSKYGRVDDKGQNKMKRWKAFEGMLCAHSTVHSIQCPWFHCVNRYIAPIHS